MSDSGLFGDDGRRREHVEWGVRWPDDTYLHRRTEVDPAVSEEHARVKAEQTYWWGGTTYHGSVVRRTVVTYTTDWEPCP